VGCSLHRRFIAEAAAKQLGFFFSFAWLLLLMGGLRKALKD
jgi:hypothetical protein